MPGKFVSAYAGSADITAENAASLLDDKLPPDELGRVYIPKIVPRRCAGLRRVVTWLEKELEQEDGSKPYIPTDDIVKSLLSRREAGDAVHLILLYDPENDADHRLAEEALQAGIPIHNLAAAYDDLLLEPTQPEDTAEEPDEPALAEAVEEGKYDALAEATADEAVPEEPTAEEVAIDKVVTQSIQDDIRTAADEAKRSGAAGIQVTLNISGADIDALAHAIVRAMNPGQSVPPAASFARTGALKVREEDRGAPVSPIRAARGAKGTKPYYVTDDGVYRPARGPKKDGEEKVYLTPEEADKVIK